MGFDYDLSDESDFNEPNVDDESDGFQPEPKAKAKPAVKKAATTKAAPKKMTQTTLKTKAAPKKRAKPESDNDDDGASGFSNTPPNAKKQKKAPAAKKSSGKPLAEIENDSMILDDGSPDTKPAKNNKTATETYQKLTQLEHIIKRPDTYIGSVERVEQPMWVFNKETNQMERREKVSYVPGLYKIFDEILVNAADNKQRDPGMKNMKIHINREEGQITVENDGKGIPVVMHEKEGCYIPELVFGHLLAGSNFDDDEKKTVGGRNGYGAKLCNVFSTEFTLECQDSKNGKRYKQTWRDNMGKMDKAKITSNKSSDFVRVSFKPDWSKFGMTEIDDDLEALLHRRVYDMAGTVRGIKVFLNDKHIKLTWPQYCEMYAKAISSSREVEEGSEETSGNTVVVENNKTHERWEVAFAISDGSFQQISFVNSIATTSGGPHVNHVSDQIADFLLKQLSKKLGKKGHNLKANHIRNHIFVFVNCYINNPAFSSQTKEQMTTKPSAFGSKCTLSEKFLKDVSKSEAINNIISFAEQKADKMLAKSDGNRRSRIANAKLVDANLAGTKHGHECTLILTEGDSAKSLAVAGRAILDPDRYGVFPLRGKMLNVRDASLDQISKNQEIQNIKQFLGLKHKTEYKDTKSLRYGHLMIMADQDHDGSHIKGLLINFLQVQYPSLLKIDGFFRQFITPIVKVWQGSNPKKPQRLKSFFSQPQYDEWKDAHQSEIRKWQYKYFKGLGTSSNEDAQVYFTHLDDHLKMFETMGDTEKQLFELAFSKKKADARKEWLGNFVPGTFMDHTVDDMTYDNFVNKELILFSMADNMRSIPSMVDGLKPGQRKVIYACLKRNLIKDKKVIELAGYVSEQTSYHHGEASLQQTIIGLAQNYVGSNNVNCLEPSGNFGSRLAGGSDAASARYIHTRLSPFARRIFSVMDEPNLESQEEDGKRIEPKTYAPVIPMVLVNGADGIGTGWSTSIPNYHPSDIIKNLRKRMGRFDGDSEEKPFEPMLPWFRGWKGETHLAEPNRYQFNGTAYVDENRPNEVVISELPIRMWTDDFKAKLEDIIKGEKVPSFIKDYKEFNDHNNVHFEIQMDEKHMKKAQEEGLLEKFKLTKQVATSNLVAFDTQGMIRKYDKVQDIMEEFYHYRLDMYAKRKQYWLGVHHADYRKLKNQHRFIREIMDNELVVSRKKKQIVVGELRERKYEAFPRGQKKAKSDDDDENDENPEEDETETEGGAGDFDYLLSMPIWSFTQERLDRLKDLIARKKAEHDELQALDEKDLWCRDLDEFEIEWDNQLRLDSEITTNIRRAGRRASKKMASGRGRKPKGDDDYEPVAKKRGPKKATEKRVEPSTSKSLTAKLGSKATKMNLDGASDSDDGFSDEDFAALLSKPKAKAEPKAVKKEASVPPAPAPAPAPKDEESDIEELSAAPPAKPRAKRATATKKVLKDEDTEDEDDDDEEMVDALSEPPSPSPPPAPAPATKARGKAAAAPAAKKAAPKDEESDDDVEEAPVPATKGRGKASAASAAKKAPKDDESDDDMEEAPAPTKNARTKRAAASTVNKWTFDDSDSESDGDDDMLGDVGAMVKGLSRGGDGGGEASSENKSGRISLHAMSRPTSSHGEPSNYKVKSKPSKTFDSDSHDDTNYEMLAKSSPFKTSREDDLDSFLSDDDAPAAPPTKAASGSKAKAAASTGTAAKGRGRAPAAKPKVAPKKTQTTLSPAAKAYAAKKGKATAASKKKDDFDMDDDDEDEDMAEPSSPPPKPAGRGRPGRAAAAKAKPVYTMDDDDEDSDEF